MLTKSYSTLRAVSFFAFFMALLLFVFSQVVTVASRRVEVRDKKHHVIGEAWIPHEYGTDISTSVCFLVLSGIQFWAILLVGKKLSLEEKQ
jgi:hypothetical protein